MARTPALTARCARLFAARRVGRAALVALASCLACAPAPSGTLALSVVDAETGAPTPARVELLDERGKAHVPPTALSLTLECFVAPLPEWARGLTRSDRIDNPHTGTTQFYAAQPLRMELPPGRYRVRAFKGIEYAVSTDNVQIESGATTELSLALERWIDLPALGWWSADDHLHITRFGPEDDERIARWMQAEDLHVANLLQMGTSKQISVTPQYGFGEEGVHRAGDTLLISGQEHPRTHFLGHTITLGARSLIDLRDTYIVYDRFWRASKREGGSSGFAHWGLGAAQDGLAIDAPAGLLDFVEVLQFEYPHYDVWYELLNLGFRLAPTAGTDFPCGPWGVPGRERFYTKIDGPLDREAWLGGIRRGRTFVTNGPILEFQIEGAAVGDELRLARPRSVRIAGSARFDPARDDVTQLELVRNGSPVASASQASTPGRIDLATTAQVSESAWFALRASGDKRGEAPLEPMGLPGWVEELAAKVASGADLRPREAFAGARSTRPAAAHTAPIYVRVDGTAPIAEQPRAQQLARAWLARLDALEARLADDRIGEIPIWDWFPYSDGVSEEHLRRNRDALLRAIAVARAAYEQRLP